MCTLPSAGRALRTALLVCAALLTSHHTQGELRAMQSSPRPAPPLDELWSEPDIATSDLFLGAGGTEYLPAPKTTFRMLKRLVDGWEVRDPQGREWSVRYGPGAQAEIVASRLTWALGYHQPPLYHVVHWSMTGGDTPGPQTPSRFRPELPEWKRTGSWSWSDSPFKDTQPHRGLLVLMRLLNNRDLREKDTAIFTRKGESAGPRRQFTVLDLGRVTFDDPGPRPDELFASLTPADVRWTCERLNVLSDSQWRDAFRAASHDEATAARFIASLKKKVQVGLKLQ